MRRGGREEVNWVMFVFTGIGGKLGELFTGIVIMEQIRECFYVREGNTK